MSLDAQAPSKLSVDLADVLLLYRQYINRFHERSGHLWLAMKYVELVLGTPFGTP